MNTSYRGLHSTDPFIFGGRFLYSNCGQASKRGLRHLGQGSVIAFGSGKEIDGAPRWMLDTVLVVRDFKDYNATDARIELKDWVPATFLDVTVGPLTDNSEETLNLGACATAHTRLRLYRGATPSDPVHGMFGFVPAIPPDGDSGFPRPLVDLPGDYFNARSLRRRRFAARNEASVHRLSHVPGRLRRSAARGGFSAIGEPRAEFGPRGPQGPPEAALRVDLSPLRASCRASYAAVSTCRRLTLRAKHTKSHSHRAFASPRRLKRRKPSTCLIQP